jgi:hypothetical protein
VGGGAAAAARDGEDLIVGTDRGIAEQVDLGRRSTPPPLPPVVVSLPSPNPPLPPLEAAPEARPPAPAPCGAPAA